MRQLCFGKLDLELHARWPEYKGGALEETDERILADYRVPMTHRGRPLHAASPISLRTPRAMPRATIPTNGRKCWKRTPSADS